MHWAQSEYGWAGIQVEYVVFTKAQKYNIMLQIFVNSRVKPPREIHEKIYNMCLFS